MATDTGTAGTQIKRPSLKVMEPDVDSDDIWDDDELEREKIAERLTAIIEDQRAPFVISLDGRWGTGKTFLLKRWQAQLDHDGYRAIYFNAWEDDFCDDPLLAIIGQLSEHFDDGKFSDVALKIANFGIGLLTKQLTGTAVDVTDFKPESILDDYHEQRRTKEKMKTELRALAKQVKQDSGKPLVFVIDELDRCRPTFAIELLERVKHIFDVPNIVFVFGVNRSELVKSLESVYGEIDAGVYLRRFFDMEFVLPDAAPEAFCKHLVNTYGLDTFFSDLSTSIGDRKYATEFEIVSQSLPTILGQMGLSLRDMDYCIRLMALAGRELQHGYTIYPGVFAFLIAVKITNPELYRRFVHGSVRGAEMVNYLNERSALGGAKEPEPKSQARRYLDRLVGVLYSIGDSGAVLEQLQLLQHGLELTRPEYLADETAYLNATLDRYRLDTIVDEIRSCSGWDDRYDTSARDLAELIDLYDSTLRR